MSDPNEMQVVASIIAEATMEVIPAALSTENEES